MKPLDVLLLQNAAGLDREANLARIQRLLPAEAGEDVIVLPETFALRGGRDDYLAHAEPIPGPTTGFLAGLARSRGAWVLGGSLMERAPQGIFNTAVVVDRSGRVAATYRKIHLFEASLDDGTVIREADTTAAGSEPAEVEIEGWRCGLSICYDLRFPELFRHYAAGGAHLLLVPANFTQRTGRDHWEVLLRARAIENQCFVVAPDQCGTNSRTGVASYGHSLAVGPWGEVLADAGEGEGTRRITLDPADLDRIRARIPVLRHRRL